MIKILSKTYSKAVVCLANLLDDQGSQYDILVTSTKSSEVDFLLSQVGQCNAVFLVGNVGNYSTLLADVFELSVFYDKFAEENLVQYCKLTHTDLPSDPIKEKLCIIPESFNHFSSTFGIECSAFGTLKNTQIYILPDNPNECASIFTNYVTKNLFKKTSNVERHVFKIFGLSQNEVESRLSNFNPIVQKKVKTTNLDTIVTLDFNSRIGKQLISQILNDFKKIFQKNLYATRDQSLAQTVIEVLKSLDKKVSTAESMTGGMIASSLVDINGASSVLYEGLVTYSVNSKCSRLGISPHFIDEYGVVSAEVAQAMSQGLLKNGTDIAISITGYATKPDVDLPSGLCYIGIATSNGKSAVYKNVFSGDRNAVRQTATNMALFLTYKTLIS